MDIEQAYSWFLLAWFVLITVPRAIVYFARPHTPEYVDDRYY